MKFTVNQGELNKAIKVVYPAIRQSIVVPICETIRFEVAEDSLTLTATNLQTELSVKMVREFKETGSFCLPATKLNNLISNLPDQGLNFDIGEKIATIKTSSGKYEFPISKAEDFPVFKVEPEKVLEIDAGLFISAIKKTVFACSEDDGRPQQTGVFIEINKDCILFTATDAHRINHVEFQIESSFEATLIIPADSLRLLPDISGMLNISFGGNSLGIEAENLSFKSILIDATFPDYRSVIPANDKILTIDRRTILSAVNRVKGFSNFATNLLKLELGVKIAISGQNVEYSEYGEEVLSGNFPHPELAIGLSAEYLSESLASIEDDQVYLLFSAPKKACIIKEDLRDSNYILIMPMQLI